MSDYETWTTDRAYLGQCSHCQARVRFVASIQTTNRARDGRLVSSKRLASTTHTRNVRTLYRDIFDRLETTCQDCHQVVRVKVVKGTKTEKPCDDRCLTAIRNSCECSCGGLNHGAAYDTQTVTASKEEHK